MDKSGKKKDLIESYLMGVADETEVSELDALLRSNKSLRGEFLRTSRIDSYIRESALDHLPVEEDRIVHSQRFYSFPSFRAAAAALIVGILSTSIVWAYAIPRIEPVSKLTHQITSESFEISERSIRNRFPFQPNRWFGPVTAITPEDGLTALEGEKIAALSPTPGTRCAFARYLIDLNDHPPGMNGQSRTLDVRAFFAAAPSDQWPTYRIDLAAFSQEPENFREVWQDRENYDDQVLREVIQNHIPKKESLLEWQEIKSSIEIPPGTRTIVVSLGVGRLHPEKEVTDYYLDAIEVNLVDTLERAQ